MLCEDVNVPSNLMAVAAATAALCCSTVPPASRTRILLRLAIGQPEALFKKFNNNGIPIAFKRVWTCANLCWIKFCVITFYETEISPWNDQNHHNQVLDTYDRGPRTGGNCWSLYMNKV